MTATALLCAAGYLGIGAVIATLLVVLFERLYRKILGEISFIHVFLLMLIVMISWPVPLFANVRDMFKTGCSLKEVFNEQARIMVIICATFPESVGSVQKTTAFIQSFLKDVEGGTDGINDAIKTGILFWKMALMDNENQKRLLSDILSHIDANERTEFRAFANSMLDLHRQMFPELHQRVAQIS